MGGLFGTVRDAAVRFAATLSTPGLLLATLFFAASLTPSLLPRAVVMQGILSGVSLAVGYGLGVFGRWLWGYLEIPLPGSGTQTVVTLGAAGISAATALLFLRRAAGWQNSLRALMGLQAVDSAQPFRVGAIALVVALALIGIGRLFGMIFRMIAHWLDDHIPRRVANIAGAVLSVALFWLVIDGLLFQAAVRSLDTSFRQIDALVQPDLAAPGDPIRTGSSASLISWDELGSRGREFVAGGARAEDFVALWETEDPNVTTEPLRVYVGLNSAATIEERARLALAELRRVDAFDRSALVIATPTGTGWVDPKGIDPVEYLLRGDVATVAVQYSYLASWLSLLVEPEYGAETARALFTEIYTYWTGLPPEDRPDLYLYGLSLGALNGERAADLYDVVADPFAGALWAGPPFRSDTWRTITAEREAGSPTWLPRFRDGSIVRFTNQQDNLDIPGAEWGPIRIVYLQYASDPITFFEEEAFYRRPQWMAEPRGPDVSGELRWYPVVTGLQLVVDIVAADNAPTGYGHVYAPEDYIDAWIEVVDPPGWTPGEVDRLKRFFEARTNPDDL